MLLCALQKHMQNDSKPALNLVILLLASVGIRLFIMLFFFDLKKKKSSLCGLIPTLSKINYETPIDSRGSWIRPCGSGSTASVEQRS